MTSNEIYLMYIGPIIADMYTEVLIIGVLFVGLNYVRAIFSFDEINIGSAGIVKRLILFFSVLLLVLYYAISYHIDVSEVPNVVTQKGHGFIPAMHSILILAPLDLLFIGISGMLFIVLSLEFLREGAKSQEHSGLPKQICTILLLVAAWHFCAVLWWLNWFGREETNFLENLQIVTLAIKDAVRFFLSDAISAHNQNSNYFQDELNAVIFHSGVAVSLLCIGLLLRSIFYDQNYTIYRSRIEWAGVLAFASISAFVYTKRFGKVYILPSLLEHGEPALHDLFELAFVPAIAFVFINALLTSKLLVYKLSGWLFYSKFALLWLVPLVGQFLAWNVSKK